MIILIVVVVLGVITTTSIQAREIDSQALFTSSCLGASGLDPTCNNTAYFANHSAPDLLRGGNHGSATGDITVSALPSLLSYKSGKRCQSYDSLPRAGSRQINGGFSDDLSDVTVDFSNFSLDVEMDDDVRRLFVTGLSFGFIDCW